MNCLKCGRETDQTFCESCREVMAQYPVRPGTIIQLPKNHRSYHRAQPRRPQMDPLRQILEQRKTIRRMAVTISVLTVLVLALGYLLVRMRFIETAPPLGQNYSTVARPTGESVSESSPG